MAVAQVPTEGWNLPRTPLADRVGHTPLIPLSQVAKDLPSAGRILAKAEWLNPGGSVKDRPALSILQSALRSGALGSGRILLDSTSGNMGIAYATLAPSFGVRVHLAVPANAGKARLAILRALGAELTLTDPLEGSDGARLVAAEMAAAQPETFFYADQYANPANWQAHFRTTGPELLAQTQGGITHLVCGLGTTGTLTGTGRYLRQHAPRVQLVAVQPDGPLHGIEGLKHLPTSVIPPIFDPSLPDRTLTVTTEAAYEMTRRLAKEEGLLVGVSAGAAVAAALELAAGVDRGVIVAILPDSGLKYLDEPFWSGR
jgi:S-sulfo-L-cysteine synthase (O-acetyl-L-serine-dependent)